MKESKREDPSPVSSILVHRQTQTQEIPTQENMNVKNGILEAAAVHPSKYH